MSLWVSVCLCACACVECICMSVCVCLCYCLCFCVYVCVWLCLRMFVCVSLYLSFCVCVFMCLCVLWWAPNSEISSARQALCHWVSPSNHYFIFLFNKRKECQVALCLIFNLLKSSNIHIKKSKRFFQKRIFAVFQNIKFKTLSQLYVTSIGLPLFKFTDIFILILIIQKIMCPPCPVLGIWQAHLSCFINVV